MDAFGEGPQQRAELFAGQASAVLTVVTRQAREVELSGQLRGALASRAVIDQAIGIVMAEDRCDAAHAFDVLRQASQHQNRKLREIAVDIVTAVGGGPPPQTPAFHDPS